jgi:hypothetical protein
MAAARSSALPLWPLPLAAGVLPIVGALLALWIGGDAGLVPRCNPLLEGCVSVSRAGRHGLANILFRGLLLPAAVLQGLTWCVVQLWLREHGAGQRRVRAIAPLGVIAGVFLVVYGTFLGTEGPTYQWLRRYGTVVYFGFTCLNMLFAGGAIRALAQARTLRTPWRLDAALLVFCGVLVTMGVLNTMAAPWFAEATMDRLQNVAEWWAGLVFSLVFFTFAVLWRHADLRGILKSGP